VTVIILILILLVFFSTKKVYEDFHSLRGRLARSRDYLNKFNKTCVKTKGKVLSTGYNVEYDYPGLTGEDVLGKDATESETSRFEEKRSENRINVKEYGKILFRYGYKFNSNRIVSRTVSIYGDKSDLEFFYKYKKGDNVEVFVDPDNPLICALVKPIEKDHDEVVWENIMAFIPKTALVGILWFFLAGVIYSSF
jgi:hypothetical protein